MRKILFTLILILTVSFQALAHVRNVQDNFQVVYNVLDLSGHHVSGQTITLQIKKISNGFWFDFADSTFKSSGWTNKTTNLTENATDGFYFYTFDPPASETTAEQYQFLVDNQSVTYADHRSLTVTYQDFQSIMDATDGNKEGAVYTGIENMIRRHGR